MLTKTQRERSQAIGEAEKAKHEERREYFITDPNMRNIGNTRIAPGAKSVVLSYTEAKMFIGNGLTTIDPEQAAKDKAEHDKAAELAAAEERDRQAAVADRASPEVRGEEAAAEEAPAAPAATTHKKAR